MRMKAEVLGLVAATALWEAASGGVCRGTFVNMDAWCFWNTPHEEIMCERGLKDDIDFYLKNGGVEALVFNMNFQRVFFDSKAWTPYAKDVELRDDGTLWLRGKRVTSPGGAVIHDETSYIRMYRNLKLMQKNCPDYMRVRYDYCHEKGVELWYSMRMNDVHWTQPGLEERPQHSDFWYFHAPRLSRAWYRRPWFKEWEWSNYALDYGQKEVYDYNLALVREYLLDYPSDGLELDWLRSVPAFRPGADEAGRPVLTRFMRDVKAIAREASMKWGRAIRIGVRVPTRVQEALDLGMDVPAWAEEGLVDLVVPSPLSVRAEQDVEVELWRRVLPARTILAPAVDMYAASGDMERTQLSMDCAFASDYYRGGADTVYVYNHFRAFTNVFANIQEFYGLAGDRDAVSARERRHILTWRERAGTLGYPESPYPESIAPGSAAYLRLNLGEKTAGRDATLVFGMTEPVAADIWLNGVRCGTPGEIAAPAFYPKSTPERPVRYYRLALPAGVAHDGWNVFDFHNVGERPVRREHFVWVDVTVAAASPSPAAAPASVAPPAVELRDRAVWIDGRKTRLLAGTMHYFRVPRDCWRDRLEKGKAMGLNAVETYMPWNLHERQRGAFDFSGNLDFEAYVKLAQELGLYVILRPGPYICSEWDNGGIPSWLMVEPGVRFRRMNGPYLAAVDRYLDVIVPKIVALDRDHGGPVVAIQLENEYGSYAGDKAYVARLRDRYRDAGCRVPLFCADGADAPNLEHHVGQLCATAGTLDGVWECFNFGTSAKDVIGFQRRIRPDEPFMCAEFWIGWFDNWGEPHQTRTAESVKQELQDILDADGNVIFYALCGGTDFLWTNGANGSDSQPYKPMTTSYDFDAFLTEDGVPTEKYYVVQELLTGRRDAPAPAKAYFTAKPELKGTVRLFDCLDAVATRKVRDAPPLTFEELGTDFGFVFYRTRVPGSIADPIRAPFVFRQVRDRANVFVDGRPFCTYWRNDKTNVSSVEALVPTNGAELGLLVENMGRINFSSLVGLDTKGICQDVCFSHLVLTDWEMWTLPLDNPDTDRLVFGAPEASVDVPAFHLFTFDCAEPKDSFLKFPGAHGLVWVNGRPCGRYWNVGPGDALYVPASYLKKGENRLVVFETEKLNAPTVEFASTRTW